jgi:hypothetical protein
MDPGGRNSRPPGLLIDSNGSSRRWQTVQSASRKHGWQRVGDNATIHGVRERYQGVWGEGRRR